ncbi:hypothetical protein AJ79_05638 [Helicocarpus griseus UAMH5409]|uniref:Aminoglycoside phosphotransferase domain-containing protein n=1 Tax=Helicocarpus griseus UAMH5409 TaxID=1447875 RepID=A0A2B7XM03_9EURO|nr:hypothetical protein AJ79_05638 [Helicocarpus griseus UAMH5409]
MLDIYGPRHPFYNATLERWLFNEEKRLAERHLYFNVDKLSAIAAESVNQSPNDIVLFTKIAEGGTYRVFDILFKDQGNVVVRLPYPSMVPRGYGVASEVATMEYLRYKGLPIPRVLAWSSTRSNSLGCEYIVMEKAPGKALDEIWYTMSHEKRKRLVKEIVDIETVLFKREFPASGSIYFRESLPPEDKSVELPDDNRFCIGPSTAIWWWHSKRDKLHADRGPWTSTLDIDLYDNKRVDPQEQIANLRDFLEIAPYLVPARENWNRPTIRHPDLSPSNIFIDEVGDNANITSVIDWERTVILPMFMHAKLADSEKEQEMERYQRRQLHYYYLGFTNRAKQHQFRAIGTPALTLRNQAIDAAGQPWEGDNTSLKTQLINLSINWPEMNIPSHLLPKPAEFPIRFTEEEMRSCLAINEEQKSADKEMQEFRDYFGCSVDGWVPAERYGEAKRRVDEMKVYTLQTAETEEERRDIDENWPFQDHGEIL